MEAQLKDLQKNAYKQIVARNLTVWARGHRETRWLFDTAARLLHSVCDADNKDSEVLIVDL